MGGVFASAPLKPPAKSPHHGRRRKLEKLRTRQASKTARAARVTHMQPISQPASTSSADDPAIASALGRIPSGLFVVAWRDSNADRSMLASWVMQAGFAPPLVSVAVAAARDLLAAIDREVTFVVSVLADFSGDSSSSRFHVNLNVRKEVSDNRSRSGHKKKFNQIYHWDSNPPLKSLKLSPFCFVP